MAESKKKQTGAEAEAGSKNSKAAQDGDVETEGKSASDPGKQNSGKAETKNTEEKKPEAKTEQADEEDRKTSGEAPEAEDETAKLQEKIDHLTDQLQRQMAEFDNFRKRTEKEKSSMFDMGARSVIEKILPIVDNFERGLATVPEEEKDDAFISGMDKVYKQLQTELDALGVKPIKAVGQKFDPDRHNAVMHVDDENAGENEVVEEFQKGYTYKDAVVRYSMVKVAN